MFCKIVVNMPDVANWRHEISDVFVIKVILEMDIIVSQPNRVDKTPECVILRLLVSKIQPVDSATLVSATVAISETDLHALKRQLSKVIYFF